MGKSHKRMPFSAFVRELLNLPTKNDGGVQVYVTLFLILDERRFTRNMPTPINKPPANANQ